MNTKLTLSIAIAVAALVTIVIAVLTYLLQNGGGVVSSQACNASNSSSWTEYAELAKSIESSLLPVEGLTNAGHSLVFTNWQETTLRLGCPEKDPNNDYIWTQHSHRGDKSPEERDEFNKQRHSRHGLIISSPKRCGEHEKLFRTYSCETNPRCKHFVHVIIRPLPKTKFPVEIPLDSSGEFDCRPVRCKKAPKSDEEVDSMLGPFTISWRGPNGLDLEEHPLPTVTVSRQFNEQDDEGQNFDPRVPVKSTVHIHKATRDTAGIYECVLTSVNFGNLTSTPDDRRVVNASGANKISDVHLKSGIRYTGFVHVHSRQWWFFAIPISIILVLCVVLVLLVRFCPEQDDEADVDADDEDDIAYAKKSLTRRSESSSETPAHVPEAVAGKNGLNKQKDKEKESGDKGQTSAGSSGVTTDKKDD